MAFICLLLAHASTYMFSALSPCILYSFSSFLFQLVFYYGASERESRQMMAVYSGLLVLQGIEIPTLSDERQGLQASAQNVKQIHTLI